MRRQHHAFTLVELLVVIAILSVLLALLLPALASARATSRTILCSANMRGLAQAVFTYATDNGGTLPAHCISPYATVVGIGSPGGTTGDMYYLLNNGYLGGSPNKTTVGIPYGSSAGITQMYWTPKFLVCPDRMPVIHRSGSGAEGITAGAGKWRNTSGNGKVLVNGGAEERVAITNTTYGTNNVFSDYSLNGIASVRYSSGYTPGGGTRVYNSGYACIDTGVTFPTPERGNKPLSLCTSPGDTWMAFESISADVAFSSIAYVHPGLSANFPYFDGHVETLKTTDLDGSLAPPGSLNLPSGVTSCLWDSRVDFVR